MQLSLKLISDPRYDSIEQEVEGNKEIIGIRDRYTVSCDHSNSMKYEGPGRKPRRTSSCRSTTNTSL